MLKYTLWSLLCSCRGVFFSYTNFLSCQQFFFAVHSFLELELSPSIYGICYFHVFIASLVVYSPQIFHSDPTSKSPYYLLYSCIFKLLNHFPLRVYSLANTLSLSIPFRYQKPPLKLSNFIFFTSLCILNCMHYSGRFLTCAPLLCQKEIRNDRK
jgi:hypothetical protein